MSMEMIDKSNLPNHIAVIMDGNGRWAKKQGARRIFGHQNAIKAVRDISEGSAEIGIKYLTLYAFSTENWKRPKAEIKGLMELLVATIRKETETLIKNNIILKAIGDIGSLPPKWSADVLLDTNWIEIKEYLGILMLFIIPLFVVLALVFIGWLSLCHDLEENNFS